MLSKWTHQQGARSANSLSHPESCWKARPSHRSAGLQSYRLREEHCIIRYIRNASYKIQTPVTQPTNGHRKTNHHLNTSTHRSTHTPTHNFTHLFTHTYQFTHTYSYYIIINHSNHLSPPSPSAHESLLHRSNHPFHHTQTFNYKQSWRTDAEF